MNPFRGRYLWLRLFATYRLEEGESGPWGLIVFRRFPVRPWMVEAARRALARLWETSASD